MLQPIIAGVIGALTGFASSFALVIAGLVAVGASPAEAASGLLILCVAQALLAGLLSWRFRQPLSFAWSTPGAAVLVAAQGVTDDYGAAIGAFLVGGVLLMVGTLSAVVYFALNRPVPVDPPAAFKSADLNFAWDPPPG